MHCILSKIKSIMIMGGTVLVPLISNAQLSSASLNVIATPVIDSVTYDCATGGVQVNVSNITSPLMYSVLYRMPDDSLPLTNNTGTFNLAGATEAGFRVDNNGCYADSDVVFDCNDAPLDITLVDFTAVLYQQTMALLQWKAVNDSSINNYDVQQSYNGIDFEYMTTVARSNDFSQTTHTYQTIDSFLVPGYNYYRLKMINDNGSFTYSPIRKVQYETFGVDIYPNPASNVLYVELRSSKNSTFSGAIYSSVSRLMMNNLNYSFEKSRQYIIDISALADGSYYLVYKINNNPTPNYFKFVKVSK